MRSGFLNSESSSSSSDACVSSTKSIRHKRKFRTDHVQQVPNPSDSLVPAVAAPAMPASMPSSTADDRSFCGLDSAQSSSSWTMDHCTFSAPDVTSSFNTGLVHSSSGSNALIMAQNQMKMQPQLKASVPVLPNQVEKEQVCCGEDDECDDFLQPDWDRYSESQLEEILLNMLDVLYKEAVERIVQVGFSEKDALDAVLRNGRWNGKDALASVVESSVSWLKCKEGRDGDAGFSDLKEMEGQVLGEMVGFLRKVRPILSKGDAMWCLLVCDMNILACAMDDDVASKDPSLPSISSLSEARAPVETQNILSKPLSLSVSPSNGNPSEHEASHSSKAGLQSQNALAKPSRNAKSAFSTPSFSYSQDGKVAAANQKSRFVMQRNLPPLQNTSTIPHLSQESAMNQRGSFVVQPSPPSLQNSSIQLSEESVVSSSDLQTNFTVPEQEAEGLRKASVVNYNTPPVCASNNSVLNSISKSAEGCQVPDTCCTLQNILPGQEVSSKRVEDSELCRKPPQDIVQTGNSQIKAQSSQTCSASSTVNDSQSSENNEENSKKIPTNIKTNCGKEVPVSTNSVNDGSIDKLLGLIGVEGEQRKTEMLLQLVDHIKYLESQLQEWSQWAQKKVMQAAQRLRKDSAELKSLRLEREEYTRLKKEKHNLEETTVKKLSEMENALRKALSQVDRANATARRLKAENAEVRAEMEAAKLTAAEYFSVFQEISKRENKSTKKAQAWEKQKSKLQDEIAEEKRKLSNLLQQLSQAQEQYQRSEARCRQERKAKEEAISLLEHEKRLKEQLELSFKRREEAFQRKAEIESQNHYDQVRNLQSEIARLKSSSGLSKASMTWSQPWPENCSYERLKQINARLLSEIADLQDSQKDIRRDRECVMCLNDEMSVVFLPCAHQVVCIKCNDLHQKQGLKDCPSCRTPIRQRIRVYGVNS